MVNVIEPEEHYEGEARLASPPTGVTFTIPEGWMGRVAEDGRQVVLGARKRAGVCIVQLYGDVSHGEILSALRSLKEIEGFGAVQLDGAPETTESLIRAQLTGPDLSGVALARFGPIRNCALILSVAPGTDEARPRKLAKEILDSVTFSEVRTLDERDAWMERLRGTTLMPDAPTEVETRLELHVDGTFRFLQASPIAIEGYEDEMDEEVGIWRVEWAGGEPVLILDADEGSQGRYVLERAGEETVYLNRIAHKQTPLDK